MKCKPWNRCMNCGRLIAYAAFLDGRAVNEFVTPSSEFSDERYDVYHDDCKAPTARPAVETRESGT